MTTRT